MEQSQQVNTQQSQAVPPSEPITALPIQPRNWYKIILFFLVGILLLLTLGFLLYSKLYSLGSTESSKTESTHTPTKIPEETSPTSNTDSEDLTTYENAKYSFSVQYAKEFNIQENTSKYDDTFSVNIYDYLLPSSEMDIQERYNTNIAIVIGDKNFKRSDFYYGGFEWTKSVIDLLINESNGVQKNHKFDTITKIQDLTIGGFKGVKFTATTKPGTNTEGTPGESRTAIALIMDTKTFFIEGPTELISNSIVSDNDGLVIKDPSDKTILIFKPDN